MTQAAELTRPDSIMRVLSAGIRDVIRETPDIHIREDLKETYDDLACRLILRLAGVLTVVSTAQAARISSMAGPSPVLAAATQRLLDTIPADSFVAHGDQGQRNQFAGALQQLEMLGFRTNSPRL